MDRKEVLEWVKKTYGTEPDYPWADCNAVLRHPDTRKWYGLLMEVRRDRLGLEGEEPVDVLNVKCDPVLSGFLRTRPGFLPAYHMNKEQWLSILLDGTAPDEEVRSLLEGSYELTKKGDKRGKKRDSHSIRNRS